MMKDFAGIIAVFMSLAIPIVAIIFGCLLAAEKKKREKELRQLIIENNVDMEHAKLLLEEPEKRNGKYSYLRGGLMLLGVGLGTLADYLLGIAVKDLYFYLIIAVGVGIGMLTAFFAEMKLERFRGMRNEE